MRLYFILIEAVCVISTTVIMIIITIAICVFSAFVVVVPPPPHPSFALRMKFYPKDHKQHLIYPRCIADLIVCCMCNLAD